MPLLQQSVYAHLSDYEDTNDAVRLAKNPTIQAVAGYRAFGDTNGQHQQPNPV